MRVRYNSSAYPHDSVPMLDREESEWTSTNFGTLILNLQDPSTGWVIRILKVVGAGAAKSNFFQIRRPNGGDFVGDIYACPFELAVELMETFNRKNDKNEWKGFLIRINDDVVAHIIRIMAPGRGLFPGT